MIGYDRDGIRFAIWVGPGRDPEVAYLDARMLVITSAELGAEGLLLWSVGRTCNVLGGESQGDVDAVVLHRIVHAATDRGGRPMFTIDPAVADCHETTELCELARHDPLPGMAYQAPGSFRLQDGYALQWVYWDDRFRADVLRRVVYLDDEYLLEAGLGPDDTVRAWPARGLLAHSLEFIAPSGRRLMDIEARISSLAPSAPRPGPRIGG